MKFSQFAAAAAFTLTSLSASAANYLIDFNTLGQADDSLISNSFGDVAGLVDVTYTNASFFSKDYAGLGTGGIGSGAAAYVFNPGFLTIAVTPLSGAASITLNSYAIGEYITPPPGSARRSVYTAVYDGANNLISETTFLGNFGSYMVLPNYVSSNGFIIKFGPDAEYNGINSINFSVTPVPEASTYAMMLAGLGLVGLIARRRQPAIASQQAVPA